MPAYACRDCGEMFDQYQLTAAGICKSCVARNKAIAAGDPNVAPPVTRLERIEGAILDGTVEWSEVPDDLVAAKAQRILMTTGLEIAGRRVVETLDVISAETALGMNVFRDIANVWRDTFGGRSQSMQKVLRENRQTVLFELRREALFIGADAVIGIDLDYSEFSSAAVKGGMIFTVATGTAVKTEPA